MSPRTFYDPHAYDTARPVPSYWAATVGRSATLPPLEGDIDVDVAVIGGGYTGLAAAEQAVALGFTTAVLEAGSPGWGASSRNGGFICLGANALGYGAMVRRYGEAATKQFYRHQIDAVSALTAKIVAARIDCDFVPGGVIEVAHRPNRVAALRMEAEQARTALDLPVHFLTGGALAEAGFDSPQAHAGAHITIGGGINPAKMFEGLLRQALANGVAYKPRSPVLNWDRQGRRHRLITPDGQVTAERVVVATNGYAPEGLHPSQKRTVLPVLSSIIVTEPLPDAAFEAQGWWTYTPISDSRVLLHYFRRLPDGRVLLGTRGDLSGGPQAQARMTQHLKGRFDRLFPDLAFATVDYSWSGLVALSASLTPRIGRWPEDPTVAVAHAFHGNGFAMSHWAGAQAVNLLISPDTQCVSPVVQDLARSFPWPDVRKPALAASYLLFGLRDAL